jgi:hypothetical protein
VPTRYLYPTRRGRINLITNVLGAVWGVMLLTIMYLMATRHSDFAWLVIASLFFPVYYMAASWFISWSIWRKDAEIRLAARQRQVEGSVETPA